TSAADLHLRLRRLRSDLHADVPCVGAEHGDARGSVYSDAAADRASGLQLPGNAVPTGNPHAELPGMQLRAGATRSAGAVPGVRTAAADRHAPGDDQPHGHARGAVHGDAAADRASGLQLPGNAVPTGNPHAELPGMQLRAGATRSAGAVPGVRTAAA